MYELDYIKLRKLQREYNIMKLKEAGLITEYQAYFLTSGDLLVTHRKLLLEFQAKQEKQGQHTLP